MIELLVQHGADIHQRRADGRTAHTLAELQGNQDIAAWLLFHGAKDELSPSERFISACARGDRLDAKTLALAPHAFAYTTYRAPRILTFTHLLFPRGITVYRNGYLII